MDKYSATNAGIAHCGSYDQDEVNSAVAKSLELAGFDLPHHETVLLKPNIMSGNRPEQHSITHYAVVSALCALLADCGCRVVIGESVAFFEKGLTRGAFEKSGIGRVAKRFDAVLAPLDEMPLVRVSDERYFLKEYYVPEAVMKAGMVINVPKLKSHGGLRLSGAIKNLFGVLPGGYKQLIHMRTRNDLELSDVFLDLWDAVKPALSVMDAVTALDGGPSAAGRPVNTGVILASKNPAALDSTACGLMGYRPDEITTLVRAVERGMIGESAAREAAEQGRKARRGNGTARAPVFHRLVRGPFEMSRKKHGVFITDTYVVPRLVKQACSKCDECARSCLAGAIGKGTDGYPAFQSDKCILCYFCMSRAACPNQAIRFRSSFMNRFIRFARKIIGL